MSSCLLRASALTAFGMIVAVGLQGCLAATVVGVAAGTAVGVTGAVVGTTVKAGGAVVGAATGNHKKKPDKHKSKRDHDRD